MTYFSAAKAPKILISDSLLGKKLINFWHYCGDEGASRKLFVKNSLKGLRMSILGNSISEPVWISGNRSMTQPPSPPQIEPCFPYISFFIQIIHSELSWLQFKDFSVPIQDLTLYIANYGHYPFLLSINYF